MSTTTSTKSTAGKVTEATREAATEAKAERIVKNGGAKGEAITALMQEHPEYTRAQLAQEVGCTTGRVGESVRYMRDHGTKEEKAIVAAHLKAQEAAKAERQKAREAERAAKAKEREAAKAAKAKEAAAKSTPTEGGAKSATKSTRKPAAGASKATSASKPAASKA